MRLSRFLPARWLPVALVVAAMIQTSFGAALKKNVVDESLGGQQLDLPTSFT